jgi:hypothetical protein
MFGFVLPSFFVVGSRPILALLVGSQQQKLPPTSSL